MKTWEEIRTDWVNGNRTDAVEELYTARKTQTIKVIREALLAAYASIPQGTSMTGDLTDLLEVLGLYLRRY